MTPLDDYALFPEGLVISVAIGIAVCGRVGRLLGTRRAIAWTIVTCIGIVVSATLTPSREALEYGAAGASSCDFSRVGLAPVADLLSVNDTSLNVLLFVPLGVAIGLVPRSRRKAALLAVTMALPFAIETIQLLATPLGRACQSADITDNLTGLLFGWIVGSVVGGVHRRVVADSRPNVASRLR